MAGPSNWQFQQQIMEQFLALQQQEIDDINMIEQGIADLEENEPSRVSRRTFINRDRVKAHNELVKKYFAVDCIYPQRMFRRRFRMRRELFHRIRADIEVVEPYFQLKYDCTGRAGFTSIQKITAALRILAYGNPIDREDEALSIAETTATETVRIFCRTIIDMYSEQYLRSPNERDLIRLIDENKSRGFPGMIGSLDCMHWEWKNCPTAWHGQYVGHYGRPTMVLEAVASQDLWIWHSFFGMPGSYNDISVLDHSPLFDRFIQCQTPNIPYEVNGRMYHIPYYLTDCIYPHYATLVQTLKHPKNEMEKHFAKKQEAARKDVKRAFGVLQSKWAITQGPVRFWDEETVTNIMNCCIILHNMIIEDERHLNIEPWQPVLGEVMPSDLLEHDEGLLGCFISSRMQQVRDRSVNGRLRNDLMIHLWNNFGGETAHM
ncbi:putative nuclease HARBI1 [Tripterygium wilfordii]|uniref:putative nuclease HARBI1 n=1 Tax=Tripterygium wilfordii TaxID=458696 RepID=UPI0018F83945|nr:putative nuclease HARBI1 [Tripterygium wilfordii]